MTYPIVTAYRGKFVELPRDYVNAYIVELESSVVVIDSTLAISSSTELRKKAEATGKPIEAVLMTHGHPDHYAGLKAFDDLPRLSSKGALEFAQREDVAKAPTAKYLLGDDWPETRAFPNEMVKDNDSFTFGGVKFTFRDLGPGESDSDGMWYFDNDGARHAFVGDVVANRGHCFFRDLHAFEWLDILDRFDTDFDPKSSLLYTGHGGTPSTTEVIGWERRYITEFLDAVRTLKKEGGSGDEAGVAEIVKTMQTYLPKEDLLFLLTYELGFTIDQYLKDDRLA